ncbi:potassium/sodium hyperpolarization-activated cyclic nucleotide-gated channel 2-like [Electrophorus electricus]|uniref:potassium/sodium hyperpolarization-activated cyclic nucleotide-gated channel 2-like n=1 Tax=Electrophorus electricus TaxID=8005 RepID=UPI0015D04791|nr:potassium/sodium hyperpolarization-activated cyclic nucleotide-gated channel 2-like [Electrophorus electricus]
MVLLCHWNGCIQYFIPMLQGFPSDCWTVKENVVNGTFAEKYLFSMFRAVSHMVKISYGSNDPPTDELEMWVVMTSMLSGIVMHIMIFSSVLTMMIDTDGSETTFKKKMKHIEDYMTYKRLPRELRTRIREYYRARYKGRWVHENSLSLVSKSLKEETLTVLCAHLLKNVPMFQKCDTNLISAIVLKLQHEVFLEGDIVIRQNAPGDRMFFIEHGQVIVETQSFQKELHDGDYFGEVAILTRGKQLATVRALSTCRLFSLSADDFHQVLQEFHHTVMDMESLAQQHYEDLKNLQQARLTTRSTKQKVQLLGALLECVSARCPAFEEDYEQDAHEFLMLCLLQLKEEGERLRASFFSYICPVANFEFHIKSVLTCTR